MSEKDFWSRIVRPKLISFGVLHRIENVLELGTPDVAYCLHRGDRIGVSGWIELKFAHRWPKTKLRFPHFTVDQANWLEDWGRIGHSYMLAQVGEDFLLVHARNCREIQKEGATRQRFMELATVHGFGAFPTGRIVRALTEKIGA